MNINQTRVNKSYILLDAVIYIRVAMSILPVVSYYLPPLIRVGSLVLIYLLLFLYKNNLFLSEIRKGSKLFALSILSIIFIFLTRNGNVIDSLYILLQLMSFPLLTSYFLENGQNKRIRLFSIFVIVCYITTILTSLFGFIYIPDTKSIGNGNFIQNSPELIDSFSRMNICSFLFIYEIPLFLPLLIFSFRFKKKHRTLALLMIIMIVLLIIHSEISTALLFTIGTFALFLLPKKLSRSGLLLSVMFCGFLCVVGSSFIASLFSFLSENATSGRVAQRMEELSFFLQNSLSSDSDLGRRFELWGISINSFFTRPFGGGVVGGHSFILDALGQYGIWGLSALIISFVAFFKNYIKPYARCEIYPYLLFVYVENLLFAILNPVNSYEFFTLIIPLFIHVILNNNLEKDY